MLSGKEKLVKDLEVATQMSAKMEEYLNSDEIFWQKIDDDLVPPTFGGYWLREHRLLALQDKLLDGAQQSRLKTTVARFDRVYSRNKLRAGAKAQQELTARVRQWGNDLDELLQDDFPSMAYYGADVEVRAIITILFDKLQQNSVQISAAVSSQLDRLDKQLEKRWQAGKFIWPVDWAAAYPQDDYWWLYGKLM